MVSNDITRAQFVETRNLGTCQHANYSCIFLVYTLQNALQSLSYTSVSGISPNAEVFFSPRTSSKVGARETKISE